MEVKQLDIKLDALCQTGRCKVHHKAIMIIIMKIVDAFEEVLQAQIGDNPKASHQDTMAAGVIQQFKTKLHVQGKLINKDDNNLNLESTRAYHNATAH